MQTTTPHEGADSMPETALRFERVSFGYDGREVVSDVSLRIEPGERIGLLGPNGAGKSTLLRLASGVLRPSQGQIWLGQEALRALPRMEIARRIAVVPQEFAVQFAYTVRQLVELGRTPHTGRWGLLRRADREAVDGALAATDLVPFAERVFNSLSGGERQRVLVAMALAQQSPLVLLDEPTAHLDIRHQIEVLELLSRLNREHKLTVVAALHDLNLAARYFPRLVLLRQRTLADGPPGTVLNSKLLSRVYQTPVQVGILRGDAALSVLPPGGGDARGVSRTMGSTTSGATARVHVVAGGGSGEFLMRALADAGIVFSAGALNVGDSDYVLARQLAETCVAEQAYSSVSPDALRVSQRLMEAANTVVICPTPFGTGNVALLDAALRAAQSGCRVLLLEPEWRQQTGETNEEELLSLWRERDFTDGHAPMLATHLLAAGADVMTTSEEIVVRLGGAGH